MKPHLKLLGAALLAFGMPHAAHAEFQVRSPIVEYQECEFEHNGSLTFDKKKSGLNNSQSYTNDVGCGITPFWKLELEAEFDGPSGSNLKYNATTLENTFQLAPQGEHWADLGFFVEYSQSALKTQPNTVTFGPIVQKEAPGFWGRDTLHTLNLFVAKDLGHNRTDDTGFAFAWQSRLRLNPLFEPGIEYYSNIGNIESPGKLADQQHRLGPMFAGNYGLAAYGEIKYELGYLFGLTRATEKGAARWRLEYELPF